MGKGERQAREGARAIMGMRLGGTGIQGTLEGVSRATVGSGRESKIGWIQGSG